MNSESTATGPTATEYQTNYTLKVGFYDVEEAEDGTRIRATGPKTRRYTHLHDMDEVLAYEKREKATDGRPVLTCHNAVSDGEPCGVWNGRITMLWAIRETGYAISFDREHHPAI